MNYVVDKVKGGVKRGCVHFDTPSFFILFLMLSLVANFALIIPMRCALIGQTKEAWIIIIF